MTTKFDQNYIVCHADAPLLQNDTQYIGTWQVRDVLYKHM